MSFLRNMQVTPSSEQERCCVCLHVRFATILLGCYLIIINTSFILFLPLTQDGLQYVNGTSDTGYANSNGMNAHSTGDDSNPQKVDASVVDDGQKSSSLPPSDFLALKLHIRTNMRYEDSRYSTENSRVEPLKYFLQIAVAIMLVYGAHSYKSMYLMPFMCIRFFQLLRTVLGVAAWLTHAVRDYDAAPQELESELINEEPEMREIDPMAEFMSTDYGFLASVLFFFLYLNILIYTLSIVWRCYKFILRRNRENIRRINNLTGGDAVAGSASFWGPDGSVNPPVAGNWLNELERDEYNMNETSNTNGNGSSPTGAGSLFKLPNYSEVAKDPEGKKFLIVNIPSPVAAPTSPSDECPGYSGAVAGSDDYDRPPPSDENEAQGIETSLNATALNENDFSEPPPSYEQVSDRAQSEQAELSNEARIEVPELTADDDGDRQEFNGSLKVDEPENPNSAV